MMAVVGRGTDNYLAVKMKDGGKTVVWHLDLAQGLASFAKAGGSHGKLHSSCAPDVGLYRNGAGAFACGAPPTGDSGSYGGNMDFNEIVEGATLYLPVAVPGGSAVSRRWTRGAGRWGVKRQCAQDIVGGRVHRRCDCRDVETPGPRVESATHIMAMGLGGSLDDAFKSATANMAGWIAADYELVPSEIAELFGTGC